MNDLINKLIENLKLSGVDTGIIESISKFLNDYKNKDSLEFGIFLVALIKVSHELQINKVQAEGYKVIKNKKEYLDKIIEDQKNAYHSELEKPNTLRFPMVEDKV